MIRTLALIALISTLAVGFGAIAPWALAPAAAAAVTEPRVDVPGGEGFLAASLHLPASPGPHPAVVLIPGSAATPRGHAFWRPAVEHLTAAGFAVLIADKRGVGESPGDYVEMPDLRQSARDALAQVAWLRGRSDIDASRVGLMGFSQGGWVAPLAASMSEHVAFTVMVSGPGVSPLEQSLFQREEEWREAGTPEADIAQMKAYARLVWRYYGTGRDHAAAAAAWEAARARPWFSRVEMFAAHFPALPAPDRLNRPYFAAYRMYGYDPVPVITRLNVPVLAVYGAADRHIPVAASVDAVREAFWRAGAARSEVRVFEGAGHLIQRVEGREPMTARAGAEAIMSAPPAPGYWEAVTTWLKAVAGR